MSEFEKIPFTVDKTAYSLLQNRKPTQKIVLFRVPKSINTKALHGKILKLPKNGNGPTEIKETPFILALNQEEPTMSLVSPVGKESACLKRFDEFWTLSKREEKSSDKGEVEDTKVRVDFDTDFTTTVISKTCKRQPEVLAKKVILPNDLKARIKRVKKTK